MLIITTLLIVFFTFASSVKILAWQEFIFETQLAFFKKYGLNRIHMMFIGFIGVLAVILLSMSVYNNVEMLNGLGALLIALTSVGALYFHLKFDTFKDAIPALVTLILASILLLSNTTLL